MPVAKHPTLNRRRGPRIQAEEYTGTGTLTWMPKCSLLHPPVPWPAGLLTLNRRSPSHDSDPDPEVFGPVVDQTGDEWGALAAKTTRQQKQTPELSGPATRKRIRTAEMMLSSAQSLPRNSAKTSSLHGMMFSCTRNTSSSREQWRDVATQELRLQYWALLLPRSGKTWELLNAKCGQSMTWLSSSCRL